MFVLNVCFLLIIAFDVKGNEIELEDGVETNQDIVHQTEDEENPEYTKQLNELDHKQLLNHLAEVVDLEGEGLKHIQEHLNEEGYKTQQSAQDIQAIKNGDDTKGIFYFFELHDFDKNGKLDGLELYQALTDHYSPDKVLPDEEVEYLIDDILLKHDLNEDGYVDYTELMNSNPDSFWNKLGSNGSNNKN